MLAAILRWCQGFDIYTLIARLADTNPWLAETMEYDLAKERIAVAYDVSHFFQIPPSPRTHIYIHKFIYLRSYYHFICFESYLILDRAIASELTSYSLAPCI